MGFFSKVKLPDRFGVEEEKDSGPLNIHPYKMSLINKDKMGDKLVFHYNPNSWSDTRSTEYTSEEVSEWATERPQYDKTGRRSISMTLFFDDHTLLSNMSSATSDGGYKYPTPETHGKHYTESRMEQRILEKDPYSAPPLNKGEKVGAKGQVSTQESINWLREHSMTIPEVRKAPPVLIFTGLRMDGSSFGTVNVGKKLFQCVLTQVDITPIIQEKINPWRIIRANVDITLDSFVESPV